MSLVRMQCRASLLSAGLHAYVLRSCRSHGAALRLPPYAQLMEGGVMGAPLQERLRSKFGILKNDKVMYKMELDGSGVSDGR